MPDLGELFGSFFEAAATLALLFIIIGWVSSKLVEVFQSARNERGRLLHDELRRCFGGREAEPFTRYFYWHPLVEPLSQAGLFGRFGAARAADEEPAEAAGLPRSLIPPGYPEGRLPAAIAPETFATVMLNPFPWPATREALALMLEANLLERSSVARETLSKWADTLSAQRDDVKAGDTWADVLNKLDLSEDSSRLFEQSFLQTYPLVHAEGEDLWPRLSAAWQRNSLVPRAARVRIMTLLQDSERDLDRLRAGISRWYSEMMERVSGRFKRRAVFFVFIAALTICFLLNINAIHIFSTINNSSEQRAQIQQARESGTGPDEVRTLNARRAFVEAVDRCIDSKGRPDPKVERNPCLGQILPTLWRDSQHDNLIEAMSFPTKPEPGWAIDQMRRVRTYCVAAKREEFCSKDFVAELKTCIQGPWDHQKGVFQPAPADKAKAATWQAARVGCNAVWRDIWRSPVFFWNAGAANTISDRLFYREAWDDDFGGKLSAYRTRARSSLERYSAAEEDMPGVGLLAFRPNGLQDLFYGLFGIFLSGLLSALGAPFWYDLLGRVSRRSGG